MHKLEAAVGTFPRKLGSRMFVPTFIQYLIFYYFISWCDKRYWIFYILIFFLPGSRVTWCGWSRPAPGRAAVWQLVAAGSQPREARSRGCSGSTLLKIQPLSASTFFRDLTEGILMQIWALSYPKKESDLWKKTQKSPRLFWRNLRQLYIFFRHFPVIKFYGWIQEDQWATQTDEFELTVSREMS